MVKLAALQSRQMAPPSTVSLGLGLGDKFEAFRGGSGPFEEGVPLAEKATELQESALLSAAAGSHRRSRQPPW